MPEPEKPKEQDLVFLNFRITEAFRREWKAYAASRGMTSTELLEKAFQALKKAEKQKTS